eukprot:TRINITY_DN36985_c0_g1_i1.p1 TRINITY_DN36985_c0_g1~~TRINITY_DN36985_c0_g1_i1.p1  ORF type:complete len:178 (+),score=11.67 TRINITY_DN36985_c0_g1_i1:3-536(+)
MIRGTGARSVVFFFFKQKTAYEISACLVGSEMCIRDRYQRRVHGIAEKRIPQDGRISLRIGGRAVDVRVSTMPASHGERVVLRLLDKNAIKLDLAMLGMTEQNHNLLRELIHKPHGIVLVTGPTGSGKSTTLYAGLLEINSKDRNILTVEDPIEYVIDGIGQTQVNTKVDMLSLIHI